MKRTIEQNNRLFKLLALLHVTDEERGVLVNSFTDSRSSSSKDLTVVECHALIEHLQKRYDDSMRKMRAKAINIALDIGVISKVGDKIVDWEPLNKWTVAKWKQPFYKLSYDQCRSCITALENWRDGKTKDLLKDLLG